MRKAAAIGVLLLLGAGAVYAMQRRAGQSVPVADPAESYGSNSPIWHAISTTATDLQWELQNYLETQDKVQNMTATQNPERNVSAMLAAIQAAEGTNRAADPYRVCYGYRHTIQNMADHPAVTGEWKGEKLPDDMCRAAGYGPGCVSTAAGAYQFIKPTWLDLKRRLGLRDFSPASQDAAAVQLLKDCGAWQRVRSGDFIGAVIAARKIWASLPGSGYEQPERSFAWLQAAYVNAGGAVA